VQLAQQGYQPLGMDDLFLGVQLLVCAQLLQHVVHAGQGQFGVLRLLTFAVGVELFSQAADLGLLLGHRVGEWEGLEAKVFRVPGSILQGSTCRKSP